jgi:hypothetical protein
MEGRTDLESVLAGGRLFKNFLVTDAGGLIKRSGFEHLGDAYSNSSGSRLIPFVPTRGDAYVIELTDYKMRFWKDGALLNYAPIDIDSTDIHPGATFSTGSSTSSAVFVYPEHGFYHGQPVKFTSTTGALPTGASTDPALDTEYYVVLDKPQRFAFDLAEKATVLGTSHGLSEHCGPYRVFADYYGSGAIEALVTRAPVFVATTNLSATEFQLIDTREGGTGVTGGTPRFNMFMVPERECLRDTFRLATSATDLYGTLVDIDNAEYGFQTITPSHTAPVELDTPWSLAEVQDLDYTQTIDLMYFFHGDYPPMELRRGDVASFTFNPMEIEDGPYGALQDSGYIEVTCDNTDETRRLVKGVPNDVTTLTMSVPYFVGTDVGKVFRRAYEDAAGTNVWIVGHIVGLGDHAGATAALQIQKQMVLANTGLWNEAVANTITINAHGHSDGDVVFFKSGALPLPAGLVERTPYYVVNKTTNTFQVSLTPSGTAVTIAAEPGVIRGHRCTGNLFDTYNKTDGTITGLPVLTAHNYLDREVNFGLYSAPGNPPEGLLQGVEYRVRYVSTTRFYLEEINGDIAVVMGPETGTTFISGGDDKTKTAQWRADIQPRYRKEHSTDLLKWYNESDRWRLGAWGAKEGWPKTATFVEQRLVTANQYDAPHRFWVSEIGAFRNFSPDSITTIGTIGTRTYDDGWPARGVLDESGFSYELGGAGNRVREILWLEASTTAFYGTTGGLLELIGSSQLEAITPAGANAKPLDRRAVAPVKPVWSNDSLVMVNAAQTHISAVTNDRARGIKFTNLSLYADHVLSDEYAVKTMAYQESPYGVLWVLKTDGKLWSCTLDLENGIIAWCRHELGGDGFIDDITVVPDSGSTKSLDDLYICVRRTIGGETVRHIEKLARPVFDSEEVADSKFMDSFTFRTTGYAFESTEGAGDGLFDTSTLTNLTNSSSGDDKYPSWSPDGTKIVFDTDRHGDDQIYVMNADGSNQTRLTNNAFADGAPKWSPDGLKIAFHSDRDSNSQIYVMNADGTGQTRLNSSSEEDFEPFWSPDGTQIAFYRELDPYNQIYVMDVDGTNATSLTSDLLQDSESPAWSPDGTLIAFASDGEDVQDIFLMASDGTGRVNLTNGAVDDTNFAPLFSPDGTQIAFQSYRDVTLELYMMDIDGSNQTRITADGGLTPTWSPDGTQIAFSYRVAVPDNTEIATLTRLKYPAATTVVYGLEHLGCDTVEVLADGIDVGTHTVCAGTITLAKPASKVVVGLKFEARYDSLPMEVIFESGTTLQGLPKKWLDIYLRMANSHGGQFGSSAGPLSEIKFGSPSDPVGVPVPLYTGLKRVEYDGENELEGAFTVVHDTPFPLFITAMMGRLDWSDRAKI